MRSLHLENMKKTGNMKKAGSCGANKAGLGKSQTQELFQIYLLYVPSEYACAFTPYISALDKFTVGTNNFFSWPKPQVNNSFTWLRSIPLSYYCGFILEF